ncbi:uncharacterized protein HMPREF1541_00533 [Cyphellophora europaea CBS 101466]|uniref:N-acetyltransferase domain-containing protein n=1 Tax=Cyphellophora europaea (strain CBS 101466) TaxID=1220924 RepID=W2SEL5_CYPE1|nr:uncharacterized protein HMPREF1541_00533 [Cyphellophora europaea CBS 101466]ETN46349.1 hypothetical protein HMPREF1541_00533 [Cyphellophora europaea CBS 101466]
MGFVVLPASIPDIRKVYDVYFAAFENSFITRLLFPWDVTSEEFRKGHTAHTLDYWHKDTVQYTCKCVDTDTDEIVGMGLWDVHWKERKGGATKPAVDWLEGDQRRRAEDLIVPLWEKKEELLGPAKHVYCHVIAVDPKYQRRGIGAMLTKWGVDVAEQLQVPAYLEATDESVSVYRKQGFGVLSKGVRIKAELMDAEHDADAPIMARMPSSAGDLKFEDWVQQGRPPLTTRN